MPESTALWGRRWGAFLNAYETVATLAAHLRTVWSGPDRPAPDSAEGRDAGGRRHAGGRDAGG